MIIVLRQCHREISALPVEVREDLADSLARLERGQALSMPLSRPMPSIGRSVHELRLRDRAGIYRVIYAIRKEHRIYVLHAFTKKSQQTPFQVIDLVKQRMKEIGI